MAHVLPMTGIAALATLCIKGRTAASDHMGKAASATGPGRRYSVTFIGANSI